MGMEQFNPSAIGDSKVGVRGIMRGGEMIQGAHSAEEGFQSAAFPVMESLTAVHKRNEENRKINELEAEIQRLQTEKRNDERRFKEELDLLRKEVEKQAFKDGQDQGFKEAMAQHQVQEQMFYDELRNFMQNIQLAHQDFLAQSDYTLNILLLACLRKITGVWAEENQDVIAQTAKACLAYLGNEHQAILFLSQQDQEIVEHSLKSWLSVEQGRVHFDLQFNERMPKGSCQMETSAGSVESSVELMLQKIEDELKRAFGI